MTDHELSGLVLIYGFVGIVTAFAWWLGEREERKHREHQRELHSNLNIISNMGTGETLEETLRKTKELKRRLGIKI